MLNRSIRQIRVISHATKNQFPFVEALIRFRLLKEAFERAELVTYANGSKVGVYVRKTFIDSFHLLL